MRREAKISLLVYSSELPVAAVFKIKFFFQRTWRATADASLDNRLQDIVSQDID